MGDKKWILAVLLSVIGLIISLHTIRRVQEPSNTPSMPERPLGNEGLAELRDTQVVPEHVEATPLTKTPYSNINPDSIRLAQSNNEAWSKNYEIADTWTVQVTREDDLKFIIENSTGELIGPVIGFSNVFIIRYPNSRDPIIAEQIQKQLGEHPSVSWFEQEIIQTFALRYDETPPPISDPLLRDQWHLKNAGDRWNVAGEDANIYPAWNYGVSGAGIHIAIVDTGTEGNHPDLAPNYRDDLDFDYLDNDPSAQPQTSDETHGTAVAGVAAAAANASCGVGVAFNAELIGVRLIKENRGVSSSRQASAVAHRSDLVDIYNNSWGPDTDEGARMTGPGTLAFSAIKNAVTNGRNGLGAIFVWAAGNGRGIGSNVNYDGWAANRYSIAVGAVGDQGKLSGYSEPGAAILICAPSSGNTSGIRTTDLQGQNGVAPGDCRIEFGGTSSASPLVAGVVALMLEANPNLSWRDVQHILAKTAVKVASNHSGWVRNGAGYWVNHNFGFGRVDAAAAVKVAQDWELVGQVTETDSGLINLAQTIPDNSTTGIQSTYTVESSVRVEHVSVTLDLNATEGDTMDWGDLNITLTSPSGTESILATPHFDATKSYPEWTYWTVRCLDESSLGDWVLKVQDRGGDNVHIAKSWQLKLYGTAVSEEDNHAPVAQDDAVTITETTTYIDVLANDTDEDEDALEVISIYRSPTSKVLLHSSGLIEYTPGEGLGGTDKFAYIVHDGRGGVKTAEVNLLIPRPEANDDQLGTTRNTAVSINVLENDIDYDGDPIRITELTPPNHGGVVVQNSTTLLYSPEEGFIGVDRFSYSITDDDDGESTAEVTVFVTAEEDYALRFDGDDDHIVIENSQSQTLNTPFTIEAWIRPEAWGEGETGYGRILDKEKIVFYLHGIGFPLYNPGSLLISLDHANGVRSIYNTPTNSIHLNQWQHVAISYDNVSQIRLYINGREQSLSIPFENASGPVATGSQRMMIGEAASTQRAFEGAIDEFRIWNVVRSRQQLLATKDQSLSGNETGLLIHLPMNEGIGKQTADSRAPAQNGTIMEAKWIRGITSENAPPSSTADEIVSIANERLLIPVTGNDSDPDGDELRVSRIINVSNGSASFIDGSIIYQPPLDFTGIVRIDYEIEDGYNGTSPSTLILVIGDGLYYTVWEAKNFSGSLGAAENDNDFDSLSNFAEYAYGTNPLSGWIDSALRSLEYDGATGITLFTYTLLKSSIDVSYKLLHSMDLTNWSIPVEGLDYETISVVDAGEDTETLTLQFRPSDGNPVFLRLEASSLVGSQ